MGETSPSAYMPMMGIRGPKISLILTTLLERHPAQQFLAGHRFQDDNKLRFFAQQVLMGLLRRDAGGLFARILVTDHDVDPRPWGMSPLTYNTPVFWMSNRIS